MDIQNIKNRFGIIGNSPELNHALDTAVQVSGTDLSVLIVGESGVGKEAFSGIIHALSSRKHNPFIAVNCGAIPEGTIDSELFGHEKGSFTGAVDSRKGYFETVNGGTIFLDEIGEMPVGTQARLLRVLETGEFIRVGSSKVQKTNVRVIAATNRDLLELTQQNKFREDLYYRLSTVPIRVPSLRDRKEDILLLFRKFATDFADRYRADAVQLDPAAQQMLVAYPWPGNIRELKNIAEQVSVLSTNTQVTGEALHKLMPQRSNNRSLALMPGNAGIQHAPSSSGAEFSASERDILYKLFYELRKDIHDVKTLLFEMTHGKGYATPPAQEAGGYLPSLPYTPPAQEGTSPNFYNNSGYNGNPVYYPGNGEAEVDQHEEVEETLSLTEQEKDLITRALKKHKSRRRDAAKELGISERTLYRKIKEYEIEE